MRPRMLLVVAVLLAACTTPGGEPLPVAGSPAPKTDGRSHGRGIKERKETQPEKTRVMHATRRAARRLTRRAVADLKAMGYWDDLTKKIDWIRISSREGPGSIPSDGHLGDSLWTYYRDDATGNWGDLCDVVLYTPAIKHDVARQGAYYSQGRLEHPPPTLDQFWAVLLAHELAHCSARGQKGEAYSTRWETRVLEGYGVDRVGSP